MYIKMELINFNAQQKNNNLFKSLHFKMVFDILIVIQNKLKNK